mmetsp:Transcript_109632/g.309909  ORF Transcript_109632/g.309909 Transcript_109632/m.309909 type:complete len:401 (-) Transcript_109632:642-1844(-)
MRVLLPLPEPECRLPCLPDDLQGLQEPLGLRLRQEGRRQPLGHRRPRRGGARGDRLPGPLLLGREEEEGHLGGGRPQARLRGHALRAPLPGLRLLDLARRRGDAPGPGGGRHLGVDWQDRRQRAGAVPDHPRQRQDAEGLPLQEQLRQDDRARPRPRRLRRRQVLACLRARGRVGEGPTRGGRRQGHRGGQVQVNGRARLGEHRGVRAPRLPPHLPGRPVRADDHGPGGPRRLPRPRRDPRAIQREVPRPLRILQHHRGRRPDVRLLSRGGLRQLRRSYRLGPRQGVQGPALHGQELAGGRGLRGCARSERHGQAQGGHLAVGRPPDLQLRGHAGRPVSPPPAPHRGPAPPAWHDGRDGGDGGVGGGGRGRPGRQSGLMSRKNLGPQPSQSEVTSKPSRW